MATLNNDFPSRGWARGADRNIVITGFMATGKTTVGRLVAHKLGRPFIDTDAVITQRAGKSIPEIFAQEGEAAFRQMERELTRELAGKRGLVIATGGGLLVDPVNRDLMLKTGWVICLMALPQQIEARLKADTIGRPLAANWRELYEKRLDAYYQLPYRLWTDELQPDAVAEQIARSHNAQFNADLLVRTPEGSYRIEIGRGTLYDYHSEIRHDLMNNRGRVAVVTNSTVAPLHAQDFAASLSPDCAVITIPDGEQHKTLETVAALYGDLVAAGLDRSSMIVAFGGGVVGDTVGFAAATYMRGVPLVQVPTTLLAMVDSSVGGKVGVDLPQGKNLVGAFKQPRAVMIDPDVLTTLPEREWRCGMAEVIKHGLLADPVLLELTPNYRQHIEEIILRAIQVKVDVVEADPYEQGARAHLNLGHTFGHAIEQVSGYSWLHGEAVAVGLIAASVLSARLGLCPPDVPEMVEAVVGGIGLPTRIGEMGAGAIYGAMATDKKWRGGRSQFVLLEGIGKPRIVTDVPRSDVIAVLEQMKR